MAMSQNRALPRAIAALLSLMYAARLRGSGTGTVFRDASCVTACGGAEGACARTTPKCWLKPIASTVRTVTTRRKGASLRAASQVLREGVVLFIFHPL